MTDIKRFGPFPLSEGDRTDGAVVEIPAEVLDEVGLEAGRDAVLFQPYENGIHLITVEGGR